MSLSKCPRIAALLLLVCASTLPSGCAYMRDRGADFADVFSIGAGAGLGANLRATNFIQTGFSGTVTSFRTRGRKILPIIGLSGEAGIVGAPIFHYRAIRNSPFETTSRLTMVGCTLLDPGDAGKWHRWGDWSVWSVVPDRRAFEENYDRRFWDIGVSAFLGIGLEFDFNIFEFADFISGWVPVVDIGGDDTRGAASAEAAESP